MTKPSGTRRSDVPSADFGCRRSHRVQGDRVWIEPPGGAGPDFAGRVVQPGQGAAAGRPNPPDRFAPRHIRALDPAAGHRPQQAKARHAPLPRAGPVAGRFAMKRASARTARVQQKSATSVFRRMVMQRFCTLDSSASSLDWASRRSRSTSGRSRLPREVLVGSCPSRRAASWRRFGCGLVECSDRRLALTGRRPRRGGVVRSYVELLFRLPQLAAHARLLSKAPSCCSG